MRIPFSMQGFEKNVHTLFLLHASTVRILKRMLKSISEGSTHMRHELETRVGDGTRGDVYDFYQCCQCFILSENIL